MTSVSYVLAESAEEAEQKGKEVGEGLGSYEWEEGPIDSIALEIDEIGMVPEEERKLGIDDDDEYQTEIEEWFQAKKEG